MRAFGVAALPAAADADADVVVVVVVRIHEAGEVGRDRRKAEFAGQRLAEFLVFRLARFAVAGDLQVVTAREDALPVCGAGFGSGGVVAAQEAGPPESAIRPPHCSAVRRSMCTAMPCASWSYW